MFQKNLFLILIACSVASFAQDSPPVRPREKKQVAPAVTANSTKEAKSRKFVRDVVSSAVALPQSDQQDRLRVLSSAVEVMSPIDAKAASELTKEGIRIESELIALGEKPSVSLFNSG